MIANFFRVFFRKHRIASKVNRGIYDGKTFDEFLAEEINSSIYIKPEYKDLVFTAIHNGSKLKSGPVLTTDEKKSMGLNARFKISVAQVSALTMDGLLYGPENLLQAILMNAKHRWHRHEHIKRISDAGFPFFSLMDCQDERDCAWCKTNSGKKFPIETDINALIKENCSCEYCRCGLRAMRR